MRVVHCLANDHDLWLVCLAALICAAGAWTTMRLHLRILADAGEQRAAWVFLGAVAAGSTVWCTHFVAMLAFEPGVPVSYEPGLTALSFFVTILAGAASLALAGARFRWAPEAGGAVFGAGIAAMHYTGMAAFAAGGLVLWDAGYVAASVLLAVGLGTLAFRCAARPAAGRRGHGAAGLLLLAIVALHFTGMAAMTVLPPADAAGGVPAAGDGARRVLAVAVAGIGLLVLGAGAAIYLLDRKGQHIARLALHDSLTGLPNRAHLVGHLTRALAARGPGEKVALLAIDLDRFKEVNDLHGHAAGDRVLRVLAERMRAALRGGEFLARVGGDEFVAVATVADRAGALALASRLEAELSSAVPAGHADLACGGSVGVAACPEDAADATALMNNADLALYRAKGLPERRICFYEEAMGEAIRTRRRTAQELREALAEGQFRPYYQVQVDVATGAPTGYEVLLRWQHPERGHVPPSEFIPLAEETGLILPIGEWVLRAACAEAAGWEAPRKVAVNLSAVQLGHADLPGLVRRALRDTGLAPSRLELEITETALIADPERATRVLRQIKALGVTVAMDDFGAGHSSLSTLRAFAFDKIKLDKSFMAELERSHQARAIIRAVLALGDGLGVPVLAEGVETADQLAFLREQGCHEAQGYLFGRPAPRAAEREARRPGALAPAG